jgi:hypothetical protein
VSETRSAQPPTHLDFSGEGDTLRQGLVMALTGRMAGRNFRSAALPFLCT